jgi:alpha-1,6-mannosyltransferase
MRFCDVTIAYNESSGGIRTYLDEKRRYLLEHTLHEHLLIVPGARDRVERTGRATTVWIASPLLPNQDSYRYFARPDRIAALLHERRPDVVELGSYYLCPWAVFAYREDLRKDGLGCVVGCYFHTDVAEAYVGAPLRALAHDRLAERGDLLASLGAKLADLAALGVEKYIGAVFARSDLALVPSAAQAARLREYGVERATVVPLGTDLELFHPRRCSAEVRARHGAGARDLVLIYAGRLSTEKRVLTLVEALDRLPPDLSATLWIAGEGPLREELAARAARHPRLRLLPYQSDRAEFARLLASADVYVTAGPHETFALSVIEAQACGLPVVGVAAGALIERVPEGLGFLGPEGDAQTMADNIVRAAAERVTIGPRARRHIEQHFGWDSTFRTLLAAYGTALDRLDGTLPVAQRLLPARMQERNDPIGPHLS